MESPIRKAADQLNVTASAVNRRIMDLADELGTPLFERTTRRVDLTAAGEALLPEAVRILESVGAAREQVSRVAAGDLGRLGVHTRLRIAAISSGEPSARQVARLREKRHIVVGTPARILEHLGRGTLTLRSVHMLVLEDADRMLKMGLRSEVEQILVRTPSTRQTALFSATLPEAIQVRRIVLLNKELDADDAEITRTRKVRRGFVAEKYAPVIAALYDGSKQTQLTMDITFEDGRKSQLTSTMLVYDVAPTPAGRLAA